MTNDTKTIAVSRVPAWLVEAIDDLAERLEVSRSAAALALLATGWHNATVDLATRESEPDVMKAFGDDYDMWLDAGGTSPVPEFNDIEWFLVSQILPSAHGGKRLGAGRPPSGGHE